MLKKKHILLIIGALAILILGFLLLREDSQRFNWRETYDEESRSPYGTSVIFELLKGYFPEEEVTVVKDSLHGILPEENRKANYVFIGEAMYMDSSDVNTLIRFVESGNIAFLSSKTIPYDLMFHLYYEECDDIYWEDYALLTDTLARLNFSHPKLHMDSARTYQYLSRNEVQEYSWSHIEDFYFCEQQGGLAPLGTLHDSLSNFARVRYGKGLFYLHTTPIAFSNLHLLEERKLEYANRAFSHLQAGPIYWDRYSRVPEWMGRRMNDRYAYTPERELSKDSPLQYILGQPPLAWAWYTLLGLGLLFLIFRAKRRQRIIPVREANSNTSLEFISTIGRLYFLQNNHRQLALQQMKLFQSFVREHYFLHARELDEAFVDTLSHKSEVAPEAIQKILLLHRNIKSSSFVSENTLIDFHALLEDFYKNCK